MASQPARYLTSLITIVLTLAACQSNSPATQAPAESQDAPAAEQPVEAQPTTPAGDVHAYVIDGSQSQASYIVEEEFLPGAADALGLETGNTTTIGTSQEVEGRLDIDFSGSQPVVGGQLAVNLQALSSDDERRDQRIREDWLQSNQYPWAFFVPGEIQDFPASYSQGQTIEFTLLGELTIREVTQPVSLAVQAVVQDTSISGTATTDIRMSDFGFEPPNLLDILTVQDDMSIRIEFVAVET